MAEALIVYASLTGNNETIATYVEERLKAAGIDVTSQEMSQAVADDLQDVDLCVVASYTYSGVTDGELPDEALDFYEDLQTLDLSDQVFGVCGSGDTTYAQFATAVDMFEQVFKATGATQGSPSVKIDLAPTADDFAQLDQFTDKLVEAVNA
ncbi:flavodoxin [Lacticaseibacillus daqingensis]|uniref:flavodoxin n=1 Tax=Lacticaseibacillus daqingensis TaxID=2486014 RepID=UPI000F767F2C|nr:flavodoxin [Lacticaseibacillus daqingensis]